MVITATSDETTTLSESNRLSASAENTGEGILAVRRRVAEWFRPCSESIIEFLELKPNWDSYGAYPIKLESVERAIIVLHDLSLVQGIVHPRVTPTVSGNIGLSWEWHNYNYTRELDVEIDPSRGIRYSFYDEENPNIDCEDVTTYDLMVIAQILTKW